MNYICTDGIGIEKNTSTCDFIIWRKKNKFCYIQLQINNKLYRCSRKIDLYIQTATGLKNRVKVETYLNVNDTDYVKKINQSFENFKCLNFDLKRSYISEA